MSPTKDKPLEAVLFDLDGTLVDTAPDMAGALNALLREHGRPTLPREHLRQYVSTGSVGLIRQGFGEVAEGERKTLVRRFLELYDARLCEESGLFPGMATLLRDLESSRVPWGVVTNKPGWLTHPLLDALELTARASVVVCGDTLAQRKPHPEPLLHAARALGRAPVDCAYIGDDPRDIAAGCAAGMRTVVVGYGYIEAGVDPGRWGADACLGEVAELHEWLLERLAEASCSNV